MARWMFHAHLWMGVLVSLALVVLCVTGILLNHKRALGLMPDVENPAAQPAVRALPLHELVAAAGAALAPAGPVPEVDRMDVRPDDGLVKVRFDDRVVTEVTLDLATGAVLHVGERNDVFLEKLHSGEILGDRGVLVSDAVAVLLTLLLVSGYWLWLYPRRRI
ncbi:MAG: PepSY domain-containing protein [Longimicrobiales bacterium]|nr:PepSY domain-containing protein [Longimicrobiales bacterium]